MGCSPWTARHDLFGRRRHGSTGGLNAVTVKRSLAIRGHRTSITLEDPFWARLSVVAEEAGRSTADYVALIDETRDPETNLSSAIRVHLLEDALARIERAKADAAR